MWKVAVNKAIINGGSSDTNGKNMKLIEIHFKRYTKRLGLSHS